MEQIFDIVKQITGVMIVFSVLLHIFSGSPYRRYFQFMEGLLILLLVTAPLFRQWKQEDIVEDCFRKYQKQWETREVEGGDEAYRRAAGKPHKSGRAGGAK